MKKFAHLLIYLIIRGLGKLPFKVLYFMGVGLGHLYWWLSKRDRHITLTNIRIAFPDMSADEQLAMAKSSIIHTAINLFESIWVWEHDPDTVEKKVVEYDNIELLKEYEQSDKGLIFICAHFGSWEILTSIVGKYFDNPIYLVKPSGIKLFDDYITRGRESAGATLVHPTREGIHTLTECIKNGRMSAFIPDQEPSIKHGVFAPFFGKMALTTLLSQDLIQKTGANVIVSSAIRLPKGRGFKVKYFKPDPNIFSEDLTTATLALNKTFEQLILREPNQYIWNYKRYKTRPEGEPPVY